MKYLFLILTAILLFVNHSKAQNNCILPGLSFEEFQQTNTDIDKNNIMVQKVFVDKKVYHGIEGKWRFGFYMGTIGLSSVVFESEQQYIFPHDKEVEEKEHQKYIHATAKIYEEYCYKYGRPIIIKDRLNTYEALLFNAEWHYNGHRISLSLHRVGFEKESDNSEQLNQMNANWMEEKPYYSLYIYFSGLESDTIKKLPIDKFYIRMPYFSFIKKFPTLCEKDLLVNGSFSKKEVLNDIEIQWIYQFKESQLVSTSIERIRYSDEGRILKEEMVNKYIAITTSLFDIFSTKLGEANQHNVAEWDNKMIPYTEKLLHFSSWKTEKFVAEIELKGDNYGKDPIQKLFLSAKIEIKENN